MTPIVLEATPRTETGKKGSNQLRKEDRVPCNLYTADGNVSFSAPYNSFSKLLFNPLFFTVDIKIDGKSYNAIVKEFQFHPVTDRLLHVDFQALIPGVVVNTEIPLKTVGLAEGVKSGGKLIQKVRKVRVKATPEQLKEFLQVDVTNLVLGKSVKVREIDADGIQIMNPPGIPVASVEIPRALKSSQSKESEEEGEEGAEGEGGEEAAAAEE